MVSPMKLSPSQVVMEPPVRIFMDITSTTQYIPAALAYLKFQLPIVLNHFAVRAITVV